MSDRALKLTDIINERVTELIQIGFNAQATVLVGSTELQAPMTIVEKSGDSYHRILSGPMPEWAGFCKYIRQFIDKSGVCLGDDLCCRCDAEKAEEFFSGKKQVWEWYYCHAGLVDIAIPIVVGGKVVAVFFGGQKRLKDSSEYDEQLRAKIEELTQKVPGLDHNKLTKLAQGIPELTEDQIVHLVERLSEIVFHISDLARRDFEATQMIALMARFSEEYMERRRPLTDVLPEIFENVASFLSAEYVILLRARVEGSVVSYPSLRLDEIKDADSEAGMVATLHAEVAKESETGTFISEFVKPDLLRQVRGALRVSRLYCAFIKPVTFAAGGTGVFIYGNPHLADWEMRNSDIMNQRRGSVHDLSERLRSQIDMYELDEEKDTLMAEVMHRLKAPMQWLMSEATTIESRLEPLKKWAECDPGIGASIETIADVVDFLDAQMRNYTIVATMDKEEIAYNMRMHPLAKLVEICIEHYRHLANDRGIGIRPTIDRRCYVRTLFDWEQMQVALNNLLDNAIKYCHGEQFVNVRCQLDQFGIASTIRFDSFGIGIAEEEQEAIFRKFRRGRMMKDPRRFIPGTGIGLTVARKVARDHGGDVRLVECKKGASETGRGFSAEGWRVVFELEIPARKER